MKARKHNVSNTYAGYPAILAHTSDPALYSE